MSGGEASLTIRTSADQVDRLRSLSVSLPLPSRALSPNSRGHFMAKARAVREARNRAWAEASRAVRASKRPRWEHAELRVTWYLPDLRRRDPDNLLSSLKSYFDGLTDAGILADDRGLVIHPAVMALDRVNPRVVLTITEITETRR